MCDLADLLERRAALAVELAYADDDAEAAYERQMDGSGDFGDRCYYGDIAYELAWDLFRLDVGLAALFLALEA